jgi:outer membrane protein OmpA-like peptidoglycan-associated protein
MPKKIVVFAAVVMLAGCQAPVVEAPPSAPVPMPSQPAVPPRAQQPALPPVHSAGPVTRATVGTYMDAQEADLRSYLKGQGVMVSRRGDTLAVTLQSDRLFDHGDISDWGDAFLRAMVMVLGHYDHTAVAVTGYSDAAANPDAALAASQKRAKLVVDGFIHYGVAPGRVAANGLGAANLRVANPTDGRNRRIEIKITPDLRP